MLMRLGPAMEYMQIQRTHKLFYVEMLVWNHRLTAPVFQLDVNIVK